MLLGRGESRLGSSVLRLQEVLTADHWLHKTVYTNLLKFENDTLENNHAVLVTTFPLLQK